MDYNELAAAFTENDTTKINHCIKQLRPRLISYLHLHMNANKDDAEDCTQDALLSSIETIRKGKMRNAEYLLSYLLTACQNNYLNLLKRRKPQPMQQMPAEAAQPPLQLKTLLDDEKRQLLNRCLQKLSDNYRTFIDYWFTNPDCDAEMAANHFNMSIKNVWTKKHRIIKKLHECYRKKSEK